MARAQAAGAGEEKAENRRALAALRAGDARPLSAWLRHHLFDHVLPFWERHAFDANGGLFTCISDAGEVVRTEKWLWSQWRAVWVFGRIYRTLDHDVGWLRRARQVADFCLRTGWDPRAAGWALVVTQDGEIARGCESIYVDAFAVYGLTELFRATRELDYLRWACRTADAALKKLAGPRERLPHFPYPIPAGAKPHGVPMMWSLVLSELGTVAGEARYAGMAAVLSAEVFRDFFRAERELVLEWVGLDGRELPTATGSVVVPGHVIENMWFQAHIAKTRGDRGEVAATIFPAILRHLALGWDEPRRGGILLAIDANGATDVAWAFADAKLWWPHTEALYATLLAWQQTRQAAFLDWHERLWNFCLDYFVDWTNGDWRQKLNRSLSPITDVVALPVKDPFHLPRSLILQIELLEGRFG